MQRVLLKSKIHRAKVTDANINYEGSLTIDRDLMEAADILPFEQVKVYNISNGARFDTYAIGGTRGRGDICLNGAAARMGQVGDLVIITTYAHYQEDETLAHHPKIVMVGPENNLLPQRKGVAQEDQGQN
ncbi:aspartate 1-decarboxylase [Desulfoferrobacter suflitae]|uniref:aspartate 1-decarboxylase n=1 Tax=Desulfoferrobacter suflitae TaxID=2865782 RepID=UPI0021644A7E|nr:aspartate 1-decarboxylase [Desulfoferrobacter suflitae]MCK8603864.1 aspartate 1-decarboxylase [Desulfoferrobacter suflitae]